MATETKDIPLRFLENQRSDDSQKFLFDLWRKNSGYDCPDLLEKADELVLLSTPHTHELPKILSTGERSLAARVLGAGWQDDAVKKGESSKLAAGYTALLEGGEPIYQWVKFKTTGLDGRFAELTYLRALFLFKTRADVPYVITHSKPLKLVQKNELVISPNLQSDRLTSPIANSQILLGSDGSPIETHSEFGR